MKKRLLAALLCFTSVIASASCTSKKYISHDHKIPIEEVPTDDEIQVTPPSDNSEKDAENPSRDDETVHEDAAVVVTTEDLLGLIGATINEEKEIDGTALSFMEGLVSGDKDTVASFLGGESVYYPILDSNPIEEYRLLPLDIVMDDYEYTNDYRRSYLCEITLSHENSLFTSPLGAYYLEISEFSELGNPVYYFLSLEDAPDILCSNADIPEHYSYFTEKLTDTYGSSFVMGENLASSIDFNNVQGFHFIPHTMFYFEKDDFQEKPHSLTDINKFIADCFYENKGVTLTDYDDYDLWISDKSYSDDYYDASSDDEIYGCYYGHGATWAMMRICDFEETKSGINVTVQTYADYAHFAKAKKMIFRYAPHVDGAFPLLECVEVVEDTGYPIAYGSL